MHAMFIADVEEVRMGKARPTNMKREIEDDVKVEILIELWRSSWRIKSVPTEDTETDQWVYKQIQFSTNTFMVLLFLVTIALPFLVLEPTGTPQPYSLLFIVSLLVIICSLSIFFTLILPIISIKLLCHRFKAKLSEVHVRKKFFDYYKDSLKWYDKCVFMIWKYFAFLHPIGFPFVWWWTLIVGMISAEIKFIQHHATGIDAEVCVNELGLSMMTAFLISIIAYIATNIIRELMIVRQGYSQAALKVHSFDDSMKKLQILIDESQYTLDESLVVLPAGSALLQLQTETETNERTRKEYRKFLDNTARQTKTLINRLRESPVTDIEVRLCLLGLLNQYLDTEVQVLSGTRIITRFTTLARIAEALVEAVFPRDPEMKPKAKDLDEIKFYGLLVKPPKSFLNYDTTGITALIDENWERYLKSNINASKNKIKQLRYFLSIRSEKQVLNNFPELRDLYFEDVKRDLKSFVKLKNNLPDKKKVGSRKKYIIQERKGSGHNWKTLAEVLGTIYHHKECCFVREFGFNEFKKNFMMKQQTGKESLKPMDYYARRKGSEWKFCLETTNGKALDAADIRVLHDGFQKNSSDRDSWEQCKSRLDKIFLDDKIGFTSPIQDYT